MMGLFIISKLLLITLALQATEEKLKATPEPDNSVRFGKFCLRISDDSHGTSSKSVTQRPTKSARPTQQTTQQPTTEPTDLGSQSPQQTTEPDYNYTDELPEETSQLYTEKPNDIIVLFMVPLHLQNGCHCDEREKKHLNETSSLRSLTMRFPSETCNSTEVFGELNDRSKVCMTTLSFLDYFTARPGPVSEPATDASSNEEPLATSPTPLDPTTELPMTTHPSVTESMQHDPTPQTTQTPRHTTHICESCNFKTNLDDIDLKAIQTMNVTSQSFPCPVHIYVSLKDEDFCLDLDRPVFNTMLVMLEEETSSAHEDDFDRMPKNITSCHCEEMEQRSPTETSPVTSTRIMLPSETCSSTEFIETLMDGREVCVTRHSIIAYFGLTLVSDRRSAEIDSTWRTKDKVVSIICRHCIPVQNWHDIEPKDVQFMNMNMGSMGCPIYIDVKLKNNENFCVDSSQPWFRTLLEKLKIESH